ncbi:MAG: GspH/FimT family pseudopilin [Psychromonas sp.]
MIINKQQGFTLIELMVTVAIVIILSIIAIPSWTTLIRDNSISVAVNQVQSIYQLTRSEALKRNEEVTLTSSNNRLTWTLSNQVSGADSTIKTITLATDQVSIVPSAGNTSEVSLAVQKTGFAENEQLAFTWEDEYRCLVIYSSGQTQVSSDSGDCN